MFLEVTNGFDGGKLLIRKDLIMEVYEFIMKDDPSPKYSELYKNVKSQIRVKVDCISQRYGEEHSHVLESSIINLTDTYESVIIKVQHNV